MPGGESLSNNEVVREFREALAAMEIKKYNRFKIRAYQNVISSLDNLTSSIYDLWENNQLENVPGIGESIKEHLDELFSKNKVSEFTKLKQDLPEGMFELINLRGIGAKTAYKLSTELGLNKRESALEKVKKAAQDGKIRVLEGFGEKSEQDVLEAIEQMSRHKSVKTRLLLVHAEEIAERITDHMKKLSEVARVDVLGSLRRRSPTVGDLDFAVVTANREKVIEHFVSFPEVKEVLSRGDKKASVVLKNDIQADLMTADADSYGSLLQHFTGSKQHNIMLREYAMAKGLSLSEYGIKRGKKLIKTADEQNFYSRLDLQYIPPELRHGADEIETASKNELPELVTLQDIKGDLHTHTIASDGVDTLESMVEAAKLIGYKYIGICDHAPSVINRGKFDVLGTIETTRKRIEQINYSQDNIRVLFGFEVNILVDFTLAMPDDLLAKMDYVVASIHTGFNQSREDITKRYVEALENPYVTIIGHPSGRLINEREPMDIDWARVFSAAVEHNKIIEITAQPNRLDLPDDLVHEAIKQGLRLVINTDAHSTAALSYMKYGVDVARRGWCESNHIVNTLPLNRIILA